MSKLTPLRKAFGDCDFFVLITDDGGVPAGSILELADDDGTTEPYFTTANSRLTTAIISNIKPHEIPTIERDEKPVKQIISNPHPIYPPIDVVEVLINGVGVILNDYQKASILKLL